ncbi:cupin domain-containing protein [Microbulbifer spongiae]|uniref:Cupin domain-containing protein n=1 Tax=Microbulbifer spongiae TaxID=2944933 RepID=A0ABY9E9J4_9GAMM|nr:cupin domain-containing protein [Microbulbifer sp. MI-G]WKD49673.1 cupin domain-containing protein [Microbulbifer sp. MI-G]
MDNPHQSNKAFKPGQAILVEPESGRSYDMGRIAATFKADGEETADQFSVSEWWIEPNTAGFGAHSHETETELFYVLDGTMSFLVGEQWQDAQKGAVIFIPPGIQHDFENRGDQRAGVLNIFLGGPFEENMPKIVEWFAQNPPAQIQTRRGS